ncbi:MAG: hypothetical protein ILP14_06950 [Oscillospiraceae bacterium]|nr:hypothetical protein [Oscillospiraceae bacterium]
MRKDLKGTKDNAMFRDFYEIYQEYYTPDGEEYWDNLIPDLEQFAKKYKTIPFAVKLASVFQNVKEREEKDGNTI